MMHAALASLMPVAHAVVDTQQQLQGLKAQLQSSQSAQLASIAATVRPSSAASAPSADEDEDEDSEEHEEEKTKMPDVMTPAAADSLSALASRATASASAQVAPFSALPVPPLLSPEVPALLASLHRHLSLLHLRLQSLDSAAAAVCFDSMFAGPIFSVLVSHPKAAERGAPAAAGADATTLRSTPFPMLPHQDRVWEEALHCLACLLSSAQASANGLALLAAGSFPRRFFVAFQVLLHYLPSDFATASSQGGTLASKTKIGASGASAGVPETKAAAVWHSEETRLQAMQCVLNLFRCCTSLLSSPSIPSSQLAALLNVLQREPSFVVSLGYYIHLMLRFATKERNRALRMRAIDSLIAVVHLLQLPALNATASASSTSASSGPAFVPGRMLLLSYFPGMMSALFHLLLFDAAGGSSGSSAHKSRAAGWRLRHRAFGLFVSLTRAAVAQVARVDDIVQRALESGDGKATTTQQQQDDDVDTMEARDANTITADATLAKLQALVPKPAARASNVHGDRSASASASSAAAASPSQLHPVLQQILRPVDWTWWSEAERHISSIMERVFAPAGGGAALAASHRDLAQDMLRAAEGFLLGFEDEGDSAAAASPFDPALTARGNTLFTSLLPRGCTQAWLEFVVAAHEHEDALLRDKAQAIVARIGERAGGWARAGTIQQPFAGGGFVVPAAPAASRSSPLVPLLTSSLSSHLLRLPRVLPAASESEQVALLKTLTGYVAALGRSSAPTNAVVVSGQSSANVLYDFLSANMERVLRILYKAFEVDTQESKLLERAENEPASQPHDAATGSGPILNTASDALSEVASSSSSLVPAADTDAAFPTYYSFTLAHLHSPAAHTQALHLLRSLGRFSASHWGLLLAHLHDRLVRGVEDARSQGNFIASNGLKETVLFINAFVLGLGDALRQQEVHAFHVAPHVELIAMEFLSEGLWHLPLVHSSRRGSPLSQAELQNNATIVGLLVRGLGDMAEALGQDFRPLLMHVLYPLLEKLGSAVPSVRQAAWVTLHRIARHTGYGENHEDGTTLSPDQALQALLTDNMDYIVEQMSVELRSLRLGGTSSSSSSPLTLPLVLSALLTRMSLACTQAILPLLDDVLRVVLDTLAEMSVGAWEDPMTMDVDGGGLELDGGGVGGMGRLAYLEILRAVVRAIHLIQDTQDRVAPPKLHIDAIYESAPPLPILPATAALLLPSSGSGTPSVAARLPGSSSSTSTSSQTTITAVSFDPNSFLNLDSDVLDQSDTATTGGNVFDTSSVEQPPRAMSVSTEKEVEEQKKPAAQPPPALPFFAPASIRARLQKSLDAKARHASDDAFEAEWLRRSRRTAEGKIDEGDEEAVPEDVPRDAEGKTRAERWFEEQQALRERQAAAKLNQVSGMPLDDQAVEELEKEAQSMDAAKAEDVPLTPEQSTSLRIFAQCRNFLATAPGTGVGRLAQQYAVLSIVSECVPVLERVPKQFFPELAKFWPSLVSALRLMENSSAAATAPRTPTSLSLKESGGGGFANSLREQSGDAMRSLTNVHVDDAAASAGEQQLTQLISSLSSGSAAVSGASSSTPGAATFTHSTASPLFLQALTVLSQLAGGGASKFLAGRFAELWPLLQHVMQFEARWMAELHAQRKSMRARAKRRGQVATPSASELTAEESALSLLPAYKVQLSLLQTLAHLVRFPDLSSAHVASLLERVAGYLNDTESPRDFQALARQIYSSIAQIDPDATWTALFRLCPHAAVQAHDKQRRNVETSSGGGTIQGHFLSHPCFAQAFPNFDARFLLHQRVQPIRPAAQPVGAKFEANVRILVQVIASLPEAKLGL